MIAAACTCPAGGEGRRHIAFVNSIARVVAEGLDFDQVVDGITAYQSRLRFENITVWQRVDNLVKSGRLSKLVGTVVELLNTPVWSGEASKTGTLELLQAVEVKSHQSCL